MGLARRSSFGCDSVGEQVPFPVSFWVPLWGPSFFRTAISKAAGWLQALAYFRWSNFLNAFVGGDRPVLRINMDESSVKLSPSPKLGYVMFGSRARKRARKRVLRRGPGQPLCLRRAALSLVAFVCDDPAIQPLLPQVFVSNGRVLSMDDVASLNATCPRNVFVIQRKSAWVNTPVLLEIIGLLSEVLRRVIQTRAVILSLDTFRTHLCRPVVKAFADAGIFVLYVPALTTGWLQPLDVAVFSEYKRKVREEVERRRLAAPAGSGGLSKPQVVDAYCQCIASVFESKSWARAFELTGLRGQDGLAAELKERMRWAETDFVAPTLPSLSELRAVYPRRAIVPVADIFRLVVQRDGLRGAGRVRLRVPLRARLPPAPLRGSSVLPGSVLSR
jgi:hypothetical protein